VLTRARAPVALRTFDAGLTEKTRMRFGIKPEDLTALWAVFRADLAAFHTRRE